MTKNYTKYQQNIIKNYYENRDAISLRPVANKWRPYTDRCSTTHITTPMMAMATNGVGTPKKLPVISCCNVRNPAASPKPFVSSSAMNLASPRYTSSPQRVTTNG